MQADERSVLKTFFSTKIEDQKIGIKSSKFCGKEAILTLFKMTENEIMLFLKMMFLFIHS